MFFKKKKQEAKRIDTSIDGFRYVGINLTQEQYEDLASLNILMVGESRKYIPVFNMMVLLKVLGLLPPEMRCDAGDSNADDDADEDINDSLQRKFGKVID